MNLEGIHLETFLTAMLATGLLRAVPLVLAALGEAVAERAGLLNLGIEGMMLTGCFFGFYAAYRTESLVAGMAAGTIAALVLGLIFGVLTITLRVDQVLVGIAITIFSLGFTGYLFRDLLGGKNVAANVHPWKISVPVLREIPVIGKALFEQQALFYLCWALVPMFAFLLMRTRFGLNVRAVGENPFAADAAGVDVVRVRYLAIAIGGIMAGFAGAYLAVADLRIFTEGMTVGSGFIALAITMLGRWNPYRIVIGAVLFGMLRALGDGLQVLGVDIRTEFIGMMPYIGIMVALIVLAGRTALPAALGVPYARGHRGSDGLEGDGPLRCSLRAWASLKRASHRCAGTAPQKGGDAQGCDEAEHTEPFGGSGRQGGNLVLWCKFLEGSKERRGNHE